MSAQQNTSSRTTPTKARRGGAAHRGTVRSREVDTASCPSGRSRARSAKSSSRLGWGSAQALAARQAATESSAAAPRRDTPAARTKARAASSGNARRPRAAVPEVSATGTVRGPVGRSVDTVLEWLETHTHLADSVRNRVEAVTSKLRERTKALVETPRGPGVAAGLAGLRAVLAGENPMWPATKGFVSGLSAKTKVTLILLLFLALLLGPVLLVILLLALVVVGLVAAVRAAGK